MYTGNFSFADRASRPVVLNAFYAISGFYLSAFTGNEGDILKVEYVNINNFFRNSETCTFSTGSPTL